VLVQREKVESSVRDEQEPDEISIPKDGVRHELAVVRPDYPHR